MSAREERLTPATRNYVIFGLAFVVAVGLAVWDWADPRERRGEADSALRLLIVSPTRDLPIDRLTDIDGFNVSQISPNEAVAYGRELLGDDAAPHKAAIAYADEHGYGFVALDLVARPRTLHAELVDWQLDAGAARFAVYSVGDVAEEGPRMRSVELPAGPLYIDPRLADLDSIRLALYNHPDLTRLWTTEPGAAQVQARQVLDNRGLDGRRTLIEAEHARWVELERAWPEPTSEPRTLTGAWERVQAAPIVGGVLLEVRRVHARVSFYRDVELVTDDRATLTFLPNAALRDPKADLIGARRTPCAGLPERHTERAVVAPDGSAIIIFSRPGAPLLYVFEQDPSDPAASCEARLVDSVKVHRDAVGRPRGGAMAWNYDDDWLRWWDGGAEHEAWVAGLGSSSGPWWVGDGLLAMIGERSTVELDPEFEPVLVLFALASGAGEPTRVELGTRELFGERQLDAPLFDLRPSGASELIVSTERCPGEALEDPRPCLHRIATETLAVETLGPIPPHVELAVAAGGSRVAWIDGEQHHLWVADLHGPNRLIPRRLDGDDAPERSLRISADGRVVLSEIDVELRSSELELGPIRLARAFVLDP